MLGDNLIDGDNYYYNGAYTVPMLVENQELDLRAILAALGRDVGGDSVYLRLTTDVEITVKLNATTLAEIPVTVAAGLTFDRTMRISKLFFSHIGASSAASDATVTILAM